MINGMRNARIVFMVHMIVLGVLSSPVYSGETSVSLGVSYFKWREYGFHGARLLKESGPLVHVGFAGRYGGTSLRLAPSVELFGGGVNYDGATQEGVPVETTTNYGGIKFSGDLGGRVRVGKAGEVEPFGGIGLRGWYRDIEDNVSSNGSRAYGYREQWFMLHLRAGIRGEVLLERGSQLFAETGLTLPLVNRNTAYLSEIGLGSDVTMEPKRKISLFAETGVKIGRIRASVFYDGLRFSASEVVFTEAGGFFQPESKADIYGFKAGYLF